MASKFTFNEQMKLVSNSLQSLALALTIAIAGVSWNDGFSFYLVFWAFGAISMYAGAYAALGILEEYDP